MSVKKFWLMFPACFLLCGAVYAADVSAKELRRDGYFENTRTVVILAPIDADGAPYIASRMKKSLNGIFRYPYYRPTDAVYVAGESFSKIAEEHKADIVVMPVVAEFTQFRHYRPFWGGDAFVTTAAHLLLYYWETGMDGTAVSEAKFFDRKEEGPDTDPNWIFDAMWKQLMKRFPYRRVPIDRSTNLTGHAEVSEERNES